MKKIVPLALVAVLALALAGCGSKGSSQEATSTQDASVTAASSMPAAGATSSASADKTTAVTWANAVSAAEAAKAAGLTTFGVPESLTIGDLVFTAPQFASGGGVAQATYETPATMFVVRKGTSTHTAPISDRDLATFPQKWNQSIDGLDVTLYGPEQDKATVLVWRDGGQEYGVTFQGLGGDEMTMDPDFVADFVAQVKAANAQQAAQTSTQGAQDAQGSQNSQGAQNAVQDTPAANTNEEPVVVEEDGGNYSTSGGELTLTESEAVDMVQNTYGGTYTGSDMVETDAYGPCWYVTTQDEDGVAYGYYVDTYGNIYNIYAG